MFQSATNVNTRFNFCVWPGIAVAVDPGTALLGHAVPVSTHPKRCCTPTVLVTTSSIPCLAATSGNKPIAVVAPLPVTARLGLQSLLRDENNPRALAEALEPGLSLSSANIAV